MKSDYVTKEEFNRFRERTNRVFENQNAKFEDAFEETEALLKALNEHTKWLDLHNEMFHKLGESRSMNRYLDWTGSGNPLSPINIGISTTYDKFNRKPGNSRSGCMTLILVFVCVIIIAGLVIGG